MLLHLVGRLLVDLDGLHHGDVVAHGELLAVSGRVFAGAAHCGVRESLRDKGNDGRARGGFKASERAGEAL